MYHDSSSPISDVFYLIIGIIILVCQIVLFIKILAMSKDMRKLTNFMVYGDRPERSSEADAEKHEQAIGERIGWVITLILGVLVVGFILSKI